MTLYRFDQCELDVAARELRVAGQPVHVEPQVFDVLTYLVRHRDRAVSKIEILDQVWGSQFVAEAALASRVKAARRAIGDDGSDQRLIFTVRGHGYRFIGEVTELDHRPAPTARPPQTRPLRGPRTRLIGRDDDVARVTTLVNAHPVVTITGPGGAGKSTLALSVLPLTARADEQVVLAELAPAGDLGAVVRTVAEAAGIDGVGASEPDALAAALAARPTLLALDNCEHVSEAAAALVDAVLDRGSTVRILTTSREPLHVEGEVLHRLGSLGPHAGELFVQRATAATGQAGLWSAADPVVQELCEHLDGLPLAIELAAAQLAHVTVHDLADRLPERLQLLVARRPRAGARHANLEDTIAWSYDLLGPDSRTVFDQLGVFPASFDLASAEAVCRSEGSTLTVLGDLVGKSLVVHEPKRARYTLLETIRMFAAGRLGSSGHRDEVVERLRRHVVDRGAAMTRAQAWAASSLAAKSHDDMDTIRFAFDVCLATGEFGDAVDIALEVSPVWRNAASYAEGQRWVAALRAADLSPRDRLWTDVLAADVALGSGSPRGLRAAADTIVAGGESLGDRDAVLIGTLYQGMLLGDPAQALIRLERARAGALVQSVPRLAQLASAVAVVARLLAGQGSPAASEVEELLESASPDGYDRYITFWAIWVTALAASDPRELRRLMDIQLDNVRSSGLRENWLTMFCHVLTKIADGTPWVTQLQDARRRARIEGRDSDADTALALAYAAACDGEFETAAELLSAGAGRLFHDTGNYVHYRVVRDFIVRPALDRQAFEAATERGRVLDLSALLERHELTRD
jgi:predicted ATPase/DNA-binding winged helix-turn-helix (wHTH) protein